MAIYKINEMLKDSRVDFEQLTEMFISALGTCNFSQVRHDFILDLFLSLNNPDTKMKLLAKKYNLSAGCVTQSRARILASLARLPLTEGVSFAQLMPGAKIFEET